MLDSSTQQAITPQMVQRFAATARKRMRIDGGGSVNGSVLRAGLIDELSLVLAPVADGRTGIPTVFDADGADTKRKGTRFRLKSVKRLERDFLWLRYAKA